MTILSAVQDASVKVVGSKPAAVFSAADATALRFQQLVVESGEAITAAHDWRLLTTLATLTGDGSTTDFALPSDYDRMKRETKIMVTGTLREITPAQDMQHWLEMLQSGVIGVPGYWIIYGGFLRIMPALGPSETAKFFYQSNRIWSNGGTPSNATPVDGWSFRLDERLLTLDMVWRWRASRGLDYSQAKEDFDIAFGEASGRDRGARVLTAGRRRSSLDFPLAYPGTITP